MSATAAQPSPERGRSRTRIGSDDARAWVRKLRLGNPYAKAILMATANYTNEDGSAFPGIATLHLDTDIAEETIVSRLRWCESIGAIALFKCWIDENGRRNHDGRGRISSYEIRFLFDADLDAIEVNAAGSVKPRTLRGAALASHDKVISPRHGREQTEEDGEEISPRHGREQNEISPRLAPGLPPPPATRIEEPEEKEDSPPTPQGGCEVQQNADQESEAKQWPHAESWSRFEEAYSEPILRQSIARQVWSALADDEQAAATKAAKGYVLHRRAQKKPPNVINAHTFLRERDAWPGYAKLVPPEPASVRKILCASDEWCALQVIRRIAGFSPMTGDAAFSGEVPAGAAALAAYFSDGMSDTENWVALEAKQGDGRDDKRFIAWRQRAHEWLRVWIEPERIYVEPKGQETGVLHMPDGTERRYRKFVMGLVVPAEWPPAKHGEAQPPLPHTPTTNT